jgi:hypothetical protein
MRVDLRAAASVSGCGDSGDNYVDAQATASAISLLSTLATELMEDGSLVTLNAGRQNPEVVAQTLRSIGADLVTLADGIEVLARREEA